MEEFLQNPGAPDEMMDEQIPQGADPDVQGPPKGLPYLDTAGTSTGPFDMVAPGAVDPDEDVPDDVVQAYHEDLVGRIMLAISDGHVPEGRDHSASDSVINRMNIRGTTAPEAIGGTIAELVLGITQNAKRQGVEYPGMAILGAGIEGVEMLMEMAKESGVFPDMPTEGEGERYDEMVMLASLEAAKAVGERLISTGQIDQDEYSRILTDAMEEEAAMGELDDWDPSEMMTPQALENLMHRGVGHGQRNPIEQEQPQEMGHGELE